MAGGAGQAGSATPVGEKDARREAEKRCQERKKKEDHSSTCVT
jgi:hypothetical protein